MNDGKTNENKFKKYIEVGLPSRSSTTTKKLRLQFNDFFRGCANQRKKILHKL